MNVLVDTSVWVDHFRRHNTGLAALLAADGVLTHPMVIAELACGTPPAPREKSLSDIELLQSAKQATLPEVRALIEREKLYQSGCGLVDLILLTSTLITPGAGLWTRDKRLTGLAAQFGVAYLPAMH
ncbi:MAG: type II toxin-antitoxin system VapC family toxin [Burkholderiales bacterium]